MRNLLLLILGCAMAPTAAAIGVNSETSIRTSAYFADNPPKDDVFFKHRSDQGQQLFIREALELKLPYKFFFDLNAYNLVQGSSAKESFLNLLMGGTEENNRSSYLERRYHNTETTSAYFTLDRLALHKKFRRFRFSVGRFPINLSVMTIFRPNDFFAPFRGEALYRKYKPGVDAAEAEVNVGQLTRVNVYGVRGYTSQAFARVLDDDKANEFSYELSSVIATFSSNLWGLDLTGLGGRFGVYQVFGFAAQGELGSFLGYRMEAHHRSHQLEEVAFDEIALGVEKRFVDNIVVSLEGLYHGQGYATAEEYNDLNNDVDPPKYLFGRQYLALVCQYDVTPLLMLRLMGLANFSDSSFLYISRVGYSLSENADIAFSVNNPQGKTPQNGRVRSEYGTYPQLLMFETNAYW